MSNVINLKDRGVRPPVDDIDTRFKRAALRYKELEADKLAWELRCAKWRSIRRALFWFAVLWFVLYVSGARAGDQFYGPNGQFLGSSTTVGKTTIYFNHQGRRAGSRVRSGILNDPARKRH